jgi:hypothetical protein
MLFNFLQHRRMDGVVVLGVVQRQTLLIRVVFQNVGCTCVTKSKCALPVLLSRLRREEAEVTLCSG